MTLCLSASHAGCIVRTCRRNGRTVPLPQRIPCGLHRQVLANLILGVVLCLSASHAGCICIPALGRTPSTPLPQRIPCGLHRYCTRLYPCTHGLCLSASPAGCIATEPLCILADFTLPQRIPCGLHLKWPFNRYVDLDFASAHPMRVASAKMHKIYSMDL